MKFLVFFIGLLISNICLAEYETFFQTSVNEEKGTMFVLAMVANPNVEKGSDASLFNVTLKPGESKSVKRRNKDQKDKEYMFNVSIEGDMSEGVAATVVVEVLENGESIFKTKNSINQSLAK